MTNPLITGADKKSAYPKRPFPVKLLIWVFAFWSLLGWLRFIRTMMDRELVLELLPVGIFIFLIASGLVEGLLAFPVMWGLWCGLPWARTLTWALAVVYPSIYWFERQVLWQDPASQGNWLFMLILTLLWFGLVVWALNAPNSREYFGRTGSG